MVGMTTAMDQREKRPEAHPSESPEALPRDEWATLFGQLLYERRLALGLTQAALAVRAGMSVGYLSELENSKRLPPPRRTAVRLARAMELDRCASDRFIASAVLGRGSERPDAELPSEVRLLITELRVYAFQLPARFVSALHKRVREVVM